MQDLWADFAGATLSTGETDQGGGVRQRRLTEQAVLADLRAWLLQDYLLPYATSLGASRIFQRCSWIDGLGNSRAAAQITFTPSLNGAIAPGKRGKQKAREQAPILPPALQAVATIARHLAHIERPIALQGFVLDGKSGKRKTAGKATQLNGKHTNEVVTLPKEGGLLTATWPELVPTLLPALEQNAAIFLLNPLKDGLFRYSDLAPLYQRTAPTELFLWLSHKQIETRLLPGLRTGTGAAALTNLLRGDRWKSLLTREQNDESLSPLVDGLAQLCAESMQPHFLSVQRLTFPVLSGPARVAEAPYTLLFATRRQDSLSSLNDAVCLRKRRLLAASQQGILGEDWFATQRAEQSTAAWEALSHKALMLGRASRIRRWPDLRQQLLLAHFGQHTLMEYDQIITTLLACGAVRCEWQKRAQETTEARLPGLGDLLLWH